MHINRLNLRPSVRQGTMGNAMSSGKSPLMSAGIDKDILCVCLLLQAMLAPRNHLMPNHGGRRNWEVNILFISWPHWTHMPFRMIPSMETLSWPPCIWLRCRCRCLLFVNARPSGHSTLQSAGAIRINLALAGASVCLACSMVNKREKRISEGNSTGTRNGIWNMSLGFEDNQLDCCWICLLQRNENMWLLVQKQALGWGLGGHLFAIMPPKFGDLHHSLLLPSHNHCLFIICIGLFQSINIAISCVLQCPLIARFLFNTYISAEQQTKWHGPGEARNMAFSLPRLMKCTTFQWWNIPG